jgi:hypothetical protein
MFSGKKRSFGEWLRLDSWRKPRRSLLFGGYNFKPRIGMRIWLTVLFMLVTAFAALTAYSIVRPILEETFREAGEASFQQIGEQFSREVQKNPNLSEQRIKSFASINNLQWGIVDGETGNQQAGDLDQWDDSIVNRAVQPPAGPLRSTEPIPTGPRKGQRQATYAYPIEVTVDGKEETRAVVFVKYFRESDIENVEATLGKIEWIALVAGALALLMSAFCGYVAAELISTAWDSPPNAWPPAISTNASTAMWRMRSALWAKLLT